MSKTAWRKTTEQADKRLAHALHDLDAVLHHNRCNFARTWGGTKYGERYEDNEFGCVGMHRRSRDTRSHFDHWMEVVPRVRAVMNELLPR